MKFLSLIICSSILLFSFSSCAPPAEKAAPMDMAKVKAEIQAMEDAYAKAQNAKDADGVVVYYADDAVNMPNNAPEVKGKAAILNRVKSEMASDSSGNTIVFEIMELIPAGDYVIEVGKSISTSPSGEKSTGKYMSILTQRDGKYVCIRDIWNNDAPAND